MLCFRCEERAKFHETGHAPRYECGEIDKAVNGCYMFKPVKPIVIKPRKGDERPLSLNMLSCRVERVDQEIDLKLDAYEEEKGILFCWIPKEIKTVKE